MSDDSNYEWSVQIAKKDGKPWTDSERQFAAWATKQVSGMVATLIAGSGYDEMLAKLGSPSEAQSLPTPPATS